MSPHIERVRSRVEAVLEIDEGIRPVIDSRLSGAVRPETVVPKEVGCRFVPVRSRLG